MNILILSDLHIDNKGKSGHFKWDENIFIEQVERLRHLYTIHQVILNGDIFELYKYSFQSIKDAYPKLINYLLRIQCVFIKGNHDHSIKFSKKFFQVFNSRGQVIHIEHGHKADWWNGSLPGQTLSKLGLLLLKNFSKSKWLMKVYLTIVSKVEDLNRIPKKYNTLKYLTYALRLLKEYDVVILSHTHKLESHHTYYLNKKKRYLNSGSCSLGRLEGIIMNTETLHYELIKTNEELVTAHSYTMISEYDFQFINSN